MVRRRRVLRAASGVLVLSAGCVGRDGPGDPATSPTTDSERSPTPREASPTPTDGESGSAGPATTGAPASGDPEHATGEGVIWRYDADAAIKSEPVVGDGRVYAGTADGVVRAHDAADGSEAWTVDLSEPIQELTYADGSVLAVSGTVELWAEQTLYALDAADGTVAWTFTPTDWYLDVLGVRDDTAYVATADDEISREGTDETLYAVSVADGSTRWSAEIGDANAGVITDDAVYAVCHGQLFAFDDAGGEERWRRSMSDYAPFTAAAVDGTIVYGTGDGDDAALIGLAAASGERRFRFEAWRVASTVVGGSELYAVGERVAAIDPGSGEPHWEAGGDGFSLTARLDGERVYAGGEGVTAYARTDGSEEWQWTPDGDWFVEAETLGNGSLYVHARGRDDRSQQSVVALSAGTGEERWSLDPGTRLTDFATDGRRAFTGGENGFLYALR